MLRSPSVLPNQIGRYEVLGQLATGGMAEILLARLSGPSDFRRAVVIKRILPQYAQMSAFVAMFLDEARIVAKIRHPNVVQVQELGEHDGDVFLVLEYVAGENLSSVLKRATANGEKIEPELVAYIIAESCAGLHAAHELTSDDGKRQNLVHRDVSPQNIFVAYDGHVKILDFGVALTDERVAKTEVGDVKGKFEYMSPEQASGEALDRRSDIFAMGIVLYELATGRRLFKRTTHAKTFEAICKEPVIPPSRLVETFPAALEAVIMRALAKRPDDRYSTAAEMRRDLLEITRSLPTPVESLATQMERLFPDRIAEKEELVRLVREGRELPRLPAGEVDEPIRVPEISSPPAAPTPASGAPAPPATSPRALGIALSVVTSLLVVAVAAIVATRRPESPPAERLAEAPTPVPIPDPGLATTPTTIPTSVLIHVESRPPGAHLLADGSDRGVTPLDLHVPRGTAPLVLELRSPGFAPTTQPVIPDADQKLLLALQPARGTRVPPRPPPPPHSAASAVKPPPSAAASGFRRFD